MSLLPGLVVALLGRLAPRPFRDGLVGDLREGWARRRKRGRGHAWRWLVRESVTTPWLSMWRQARRLERSAGNDDAARSWGEGMRLEMRVAARTLPGRPGFAGVAVATLALTVGAATVIFSLAEAVLLRPLPYPDAESLYRVFGTNSRWREGEQEFLRAAWDRTPVSRTMIDAWHGDRGLQVGAFQPASGALRVGDGPAESRAGARVWRGFFETLDVAPLLGRLPSAAEIGASEPLVVIHERLWARSFARDPGALGRSLEIDGTPYTVVGVMPTSFALPEEGTLWWAPLPPEWDRYSDVTALSAIARLPADIEPGAASAAMNERLAELAEANPAYQAMGVRLVPLRDEVLGSVKTGITLLFAAVLVVVLIGCVNLTNLVLARGARRGPELAVRAALGSGRAGLVQAVLAEVGFLCAVGAVLGVAVAAGALGPLVSFLTRAMPDFPRATAVGLNPVVLSFALAVTVASAFVAALPSALVAGRRAPADLLHGGARGGSSRRLRRVQRGLLVAEAALAMMLLAGAGLLVRSTARVLTLDPGFDAQDIAYLALSLPQASFETEPDVRATLDDLSQRLSRIPGVTRAVEARPLPTLGGSTMVPVRPAGTPEEAATLVLTAAVGPGYFDALGIPVLRGRPFVSGDDGNGEPVAILSRSLALRLFGEEDPVGRFIAQADGAMIVGAETEDSESRAVEVVGVVGDVRQLALVREAEPLLYRPFRQADTGMLRSPLWALQLADGAGDDALAAARASAGSLSDAVILGAGMLRSGSLDALAPIRVRALLLGVLASLAAGLAVVGIYGVVAYVVSDQTREIGIRMALGAEAGEETTRMVGHALLPALTGAAAGLLAALALSRVLESSIYEISRLDPLAYGSSFALLVFVAGLAAWLPARRASRVDPVQVLAAD